MASRAATQALHWRTHMKKGAIRSGALLGAMTLIAVTVLVALALVSYHPSDAAFNTAAGAQTQNWVSMPGAWTADVLLTLLGPSVGPVSYTHLTLPTIYSV